VNLFTGAIQSNVVHKPYSFPDNSFYKTLETVHQARWIDQHKKAMPADEYARIVVVELLKAKPRGLLWAGTSATVV